VQLLEQQWEVGLIYNAYEIKAPTCYFISRENKTNNNMIHLKKNGDAYVGDRVYEAHRL